MNVLLMVAPVKHNLEMIIYYLHLNTFQNLILLLVNVSPSM